MDMTTFFSNAIAALAWPISILIVLSLFRKEIAKKINEAKSAQIGSTTVIFDKAADMVVAKLPISDELRKDLTFREKQVAFLLVSGMSSAEIANVLGLSARTVQVHRQMIFSATGTHTEDELRAALAL